MTRKATREDFTFIFTLYMHPQTNPFLLYEVMDAASFKPIFEALLDKNLLYIYEHAHTPVGMFKLVPNVYRAGHVVYLGGLAIHPDFMGQGHGRRMMQEILALAKERGFLRVELSTAVTNEKAIRLYEKAGFKKEGVLERLTYLAGEQRFVDEVMMAYLFPLT